MVQLRKSLELALREYPPAEPLAVAHQTLEWFSEKLRLLLIFEGDPEAADYLLDEWHEGLLARTQNPTIPVFVVRAMAACSQASQGAGL
jgi:hypothetical protein